MSAPVSAQEADAADEETTEIIEVKGIRGTIQSSISIKRESTEIVDVVRISFPNKIFIRLSLSNSRSSTAICFVLCKNVISWSF